MSLLTRAIPVKLVVRPGFRCFVKEYKIALFV